MGSEFKKGDVVFIADPDEFGIHNQGNIFIILHVDPLRESFSICPAHSKNLVSPFWWPMDSAHLLIPASNTEKALYGLYDAK